MINPAAIPVIAGDMDALAGHAATLSRTGTAFGETGSRVHAVWQGLGAVYVAPEAGQLLAATGPVASVSASVGEDITAVGTAMAAYAGEVAAIKTRLESLRAQATAFVDSVASQPDWHDDQGAVDRHNQLISGVDAAVADFMDAQRRCANAVLALYTDSRYTADNGDDTVLPTEYGYTAAQLDAAMGQAGALPWGTSEEHDRGFLGDVGAFFVGIKDGAVGFVGGLGALIGYSEGHWSWSTAGTAWQGLGTFVIALSAYTNPVGIVMDQTIGYGGYAKGELGNTLLGAGKAIIAYDEWGHDKSHAAGMATFNVVSAILGTKGAGAGLRGAGAALEASRFATVARVGAGFTRAGEAIGALPTVRDVFGNIAARFPSLHIPHIELPHTDLHTTHVDAPAGAPHAGAAEPPPIRTGQADVPAHAGAQQAGAQQAGAHATGSGTPAHPSGSDLPAHATGSGTPAHAAGGPGRPDHAAVPGTPAHAAGVPDSTRPGGSDVPAADHTAPDHPTPDHPTPDHPTPDHPTTDHTTPDHPTPAEQSASAAADLQPTGADPAPHLGTRPDGSWVGAEHGARLELDPPANAAADQVIEHARTAEPSITSQVRDVVGHVDGAQMRGYPDFALKSEDSLKRKLATELDQAPDLSPTEAAANVRDAVRYTMELPPGSYTAGIERAVADLQARGFENVAFKPTWDDPAAYKGVNTNWLDPRSGQVFELQFHTADSFAAKMATHPYYEAMRVPGVSESELIRLTDEQAAIFRHVDVPPGTERLRELQDAVARTGASRETALGAPVAHADHPDHGQRASLHSDDGAVGGGERAPGAPSTSVHGPEGSTAPAHPTDHQAVTVSTTDTGHFTVPDGEIQSLTVVSESHVVRGSDGLVEAVDGRSAGDVLHEIGEQRAEQFRERRHTGELSRRSIGHVTSVVMDLRTGEIVEASNGLRNSVITSDRLHPLLAQRLVELESGPGYPALNGDGSIDGTTRLHPHPDDPLRHAEVKAMNELLWRRGPDLDASVFEEMRIDNFAPFGRDGVRPLPCCANCAAMLRGSVSNSGRFTGYPPGPHNFLPE